VAWETIEKNFFKRFELSDDFSNNYVVCSVCAMGHPLSIMCHPRLWGRECIHGGVAQTQLEQIFWGSNTEQEEEGVGWEQEVEIVHV